MIRQLGPPVRRQELDHRLQEHHGWVRVAILLHIWVYMYTVVVYSETGRKLLIWEGYKRNHKGAIPPAVSSLFNVAHIIYPSSQY